MRESNPNFTRPLLLAGIIVLLAFGLTAGLDSQALAATNPLENSITKGILAPDILLSGQVSDIRTTLPIEGARIELHTGEFTYSNLNGVYTITVDLGYYTMTASADNYYTQVITDVYVYTGTVIQDFALQHFPVTLTGEVINANSRLPIAGAEILLDTGEFTYTNSSGVYAFTLPPGVYTATASADEYAPQTVTGIELVEQPVVQDFELVRLIPEPVILTGEVIDAYLETPIQGAKVLLNTGDFDLTTLGGMYSFSLDPGVYTMTVSADGYVTQTLGGVELVSGNVMVNFALILQICPAVEIAAVDVAVAGMSVSFTPAITSSIDVTYLWDFGDGITSTEFAPTHIYTDFDTYTVTLQVVNLCAETAVWEGQLTFLQTLFLPLAVKY